MARRYTKVEHLAENVRELRKQGKTYDEIAVITGLEKKQIKKAGGTAAKKGKNAGDRIHPTPQGTASQRPSQRRNKTA